MNQKVAVITGASRGLGRDMAINLAKSGVEVIFTYQKNQVKAQELIEEIESIGGKAKAFPYDAGNPSESQQLMENIASYLSGVNSNSHFDFLINNAGTGLYSPIENTSSDQLDDMYHIHLKSVYLLCQAAIPFLNEGGRIVNISSGLTRFSFPGSSAYAMMKGAIEVFTRYLAKELGPKRITANVVAPGAIATDFGGGSNRDDEEKRKVIGNLTALGSVGEAEDIGGVVAFLCSDKAGWINGQRIEVSGGMLL